VGFAIADSEIQGVSTVSRTQGLLYPIDRDRSSLVERVALRAKATAGFCPICGRPTLMVGWQENLRETGLCIWCRSTNRQRQIAYVLCHALARARGAAARSLATLRRGAEPLAIYNTECSGALHGQLCGLPGYVCSEYMGSSHGPGEVVHGCRHEDLSSLSFDDAAFDCVLSSDVLEHVPSPYRAHQEILRVLRPGGSHIFTVPFHQTRFLDEVLATPGGDGEPELLAPPVYHADPLRPEGILVYTIFSLEMLVKLRGVGFATRLYRLYRPSLGILGPNGIVFQAVRQGPDR